MSTSGQTTWQLQASSIIDAALRKLAVLAEGGTANTNQYTTGLQALNSMLKSFQVLGMPLWAITEYSFALTATHNYSIGIGQTLNTPAPIKILDAYLLDTSTSQSITLPVVSHFSLNQQQPVSTATGSPIKLEYEPGIQTGLIRVWPLPDTYSIANKQITITYQRPFQDMVNTTDNLDFPQSWHDAVIYGLAYRLAPEYGIPLQDKQELKAEAAEFLGMALDNSGEETSIFFMPDRR